MRYVTLSEMKQLTFFSFYIIFWSAIFLKKPANLSFSVIRCYLILVSISWNETTQKYFFWSFESSRQEEKKKTKKLQALLFSGLLKSCFYNN